MDGGMKKREIREMQSDAFTKGKILIYLLLLSLGPFVTKLQHQKFISELFLSGGR